MSKRSFRQLASLSEQRVWVITFYELSGVKAQPNLLLNNY